MNPMPLTVMSANLWNLNEPLRDRMGVFSGMVAELRPDVIAMQEVRPFPGSAARLQLELVDALADYHVHYSVGSADDATTEGLAIATRQPVAEARTYRLPGGGTEPDRVVQYDVRVPTGDGWVGVLNAHPLTRMTATCATCRAGRVHRRRRQPPSSGPTTDSPSAGT
ncbi:MAG: endonuclease/exonuclease/phosphatase family protein [Tessaracoccus sp.]|uniref:endonuclease/exonuclease/phosphatase family protein n=1 Tax=Tessaracoccus sp. TaxID=1971211 RepID=UPI001EC7B080|nr:endonuclease/exonuclease/phosphatase family protein [Tessaracoccus sp.]MBK7822139.1 endonuclease/exonuclease/phosphatase family protein [Tessaracoccus sp.]